MTATIATKEAVISRAEETIPAPVGADLAPISLPELVAAGELLTRVDRKYVVPLATIQRLADRLGPDSRILQIDGARTFGYRSIYWDTAELASFTAAGQGRRRRFKVRSRAYVDTGAAFLEVKTRGPRGTTVKERIEHPEILSARLDVEASDFVSDRLAAHGVEGIDARALQATLITRYRRMTIATVTAEGSLTRATIDTDLRFRVPAGAALDLPGLAIIETKGTSTPSAVDRALWALGHRPVRVSKYGTGLRALRPELPDLKWHRTLHQHFLTA